MRKTLRGITWAHTRGLAPLQVTSQVYNDFNHEVAINWDVRSLFDFGEGSLSELAKEYDFLMIDHPFIGAIAKSNLFLPLDDFLAPEFLQELSDESVGASFRSYSYNGHQWALPVDAAAQVAAARIDLLSETGSNIPVTWDEVLSLSLKTGKVAMPLTPMATLSWFFTMCTYFDEKPFINPDLVVSSNVAKKVLHQMKILFSSFPSGCLDMYPPYLFNQMCQGNNIMYVPLSYGYVNYSMKGYAKYPLTFLDIPKGDMDKPEGATLGGVGVALSVKCIYVDVALDYIKMLAGTEWQSTIYALSGGQPALKKVWNDDIINKLTNNFYLNTVQTVEHAFVRPRYSGFHNFQSLTGRLIQSYLKNEIDIEYTIKTIGNNYKNSKL